MNPDCMTPPYTNPPCATVRLHLQNHTNRSPKKSWHGNNHPGSTHLFIQHHITTPPHSMLLAFHPNRRKLQSSAPPSAIQFPHHFSPLPRPMQSLVLPHHQKCIPDFMHHPNFLTRPLQQCYRRSLIRPISPIRNQHPILTDPTAHPCPRTTLRLLLRMTS